MEGEREFCRQKLGVEGPSVEGFECSWFEDLLPTGKKRDRALAALLALL